MITTSNYFDIIINDCLDIFRKKMHDYGSAWRILRLKSLTDQIFIKAQRIRSIDDKGSQKINETKLTKLFTVTFFCFLSLVLARFLE